MLKIVMTGLLVETKEHLKQLEDGFKEMGFHKPKLIGQFRTLSGEGGAGDRNEVVVAVSSKDVGKLAVHPLHLSGGFSWSEDYVANHRSLIPYKAYKYFNELKEKKGDK
jgi:hypothetical protein